MAYRMTKLSEFTLDSARSIQTVFKNNGADIFIESGSNLVKISYENGNLEQKYTEKNFYTKHLELIDPTWNVQSSKEKTLILVHREDGLDVYEDEGIKASKKTAKTDETISKQWLAIDSITDVLPVLFYGKFKEDQFLALARNRFKFMAMQTVKFDAPSKVVGLNGSVPINGGTILGAKEVDENLQYFIHRDKDNINLYKVDAGSVEFKKINSYRLDPQHEPSMERVFLTDDNLFYFNDGGLQIFNRKTTKGITCDEFSKSKGWKRENMNSLTLASPTRFFFTGSLGIRILDFEDNKCNVKLIANIIWQTPVKMMSIINVLQRDGILKMVGTFEDKLLYVEWKETKSTTRNRRSLEDPVAANSANKMGNIFSLIVESFGKIFSRSPKSNDLEDASLGFLKDKQFPVDDKMTTIPPDYFLPIDFMEIMGENHPLAIYGGVDLTKNNITHFDHFNGWILLAMVAPAIISQVKGMFNSLIGVICKRQKISNSS